MISPPRENEQVAPPSHGLASSSVTSIPASRSAIAAVMPGQPAADDDDVARVMTGPCRVAWPPTLTEPPAAGPSPRAAVTEPRRRPRACAWPISGQGDRRRATRRFVPGRAATSCACPAATRPQGARRRSARAAGGRCPPSPRPTPRCAGRAAASAAARRAYQPWPARPRTGSARSSPPLSAASWPSRPPGSSVQPNRSRSSAGRYTRPLPRSSRMSRRMLVSCSATPSASASGSATGRVAAAEYAEREPPDRSGHAPAVVLQLVEGRVPRAAHVGLAAVDQLAEGARAGSGTCAPRRPARPVPGRRRARCSRSSAATASRACASAVELLRGRQRAVADVVDPAGERVDGRQRAALGAGQQPDAVGEVPRLRPGHLLAVPVRGADLVGRPLSGRHAVIAPSRRLAPARRPSGACAAAAWRRSTS